MSQATRTPGTGPATRRPGPARQRPDDAVRGLASGARHLAALAALVVVTLALSGCGLRLETPPPTARVPGAVEQVRARTVADADALTRAAAPGAAASAAPVAAVLAQVVDLAQRHVVALGGTYESGLAPTSTPTPTSGSGTAAPTPDPAAVLALLAAAAGTAQSDAGTVPDAPLARLLASIAASRSRSTAALAAALGVAAPAITAPVPTATDGATPAASGSPSAAPAATVVPSPGAPAAATASQSALVAAEDEAGYAFEVIAAKLDEPGRSLAVTAAATHRATAEARAQQLGVAGTGLDPRRAAYTLPAGLDDPATVRALAASVESALVVAYASAVGQAPPTDRAGLVTSLLTASAAAGSWGAAVTAFPGLPEQTG